MPKLKINEELKKLYQLADKLDDKIIRYYERELIKAYKKALDNIRLQVAQMYEKYGDDVTYSDMLTYKRLQTLELNIIAELKKLGVKAKSIITKEIGEAHQESYQYQGFIYERTFQIKLSFSLLSENQIQSILLNPISHIKWPDSLKESIDRTAKAVKSALIQGLIEGKGYSKTATAIKEVMNNSFAQAKRIAWTETHRAQVAGRMAGIEHARNKLNQNGIEIQKIWSATLDLRTRKNHGAMDGQVAKIKDGEEVFEFTTMSGATIYVVAPGLTGTTDDINCRCSVITQIPDAPITVRKDNETKEIIPYITYEEWYNAKYKKS